MMLVRTGSRVSTRRLTFLFRPVANIGLEQLVFEALGLDHRLRHVVERNHAHQRTAFHDRQVTHVMLEHHAAHFVHFGFRRAGNGMVVHDLADRAGADAAAIRTQRHDDLAEREHADQIAVLHDDERADVVFGHGVHCFVQRRVGRDGVERIALDLENIAHTHDVSPVRARARPTRVPGKKVDGKTVKSWGEMLKRYLPVFDPSGKGGKRKVAGRRADRPETPMNRP
ncbi:hypothetical protein PT2222_50083 [Paraburkholderia tropica]